MPLLRSVYYRSPLNADHPHRHMVPLEAARQLMNEADALPSCLNDHTLLGQVTIITGHNVVSTTPEMVLKTDGDNEVTLPSVILRDLPQRLPAETYVVVRLVLVTGPFGNETELEI